MGKTPSIEEFSGRMLKKGAKASFTCLMQGDFSKNQDLKFENKLRHLKI